METSSNKITTQEQMDSYLASKPKFGDTETKQATCESHGEYESSRFWMVSDYSNWTQCPECLEQKKIQIVKQTEEEKEEARKQSEKRERERREWLIESAFKASRIPPRFLNHSFETFRDVNDDAASRKATCKAYAESFKDTMQSGASLILCGNTGTGKTHLACAIARHVITEYLARVYFTTVAKAIRMVKDTYSGEGNEQDVINRLAGYDLLILDEVGVQFGSDSEKMILFEILNERYQHYRPTIMISNLSIKNLAEFIGDRVIDRMRENGGKLLNFEWKSERK